MKKGRKCPECGGKMMNDPEWTGGYCGGCEKGFGDQNELPPLQFGPDEEAFVANAEKWLKEKYRSDIEIADRITIYELNRTTFGSGLGNGLGTMKSWEVLKAELKKRDAVRKGDKVTRRGVDVLHADAPAPAQIGARTPKKRLPVTIADAAKICLVSIRTIKNWEVGQHTAPDYPGRKDPVALRSFAVTRRSQQNTKNALKKSARCDMDSLPSKKIRW